MLLKIFTPNFASVNHKHKYELTAEDSKLDNPMKSLWKVVLGLTYTASSEICSQSGPAQTRADVKPVSVCAGMSGKTSEEPVAPIKLDAVVIYDLLIQ